MTTMQGGLAQAVEFVHTLTDEAIADAVTNEDPSEHPKFKDRLPLKALVPTYDSAARWTGVFFSRGC